jgi:hypothetical protein
MPPFPILPRQLVQWQGLVSLKSLFSFPESTATLPSFGPIEGRNSFFHISSQWESQKNLFAFIFFGKIQFLPPCIWDLPYRLYFLYMAGRGFSYTTKGWQINVVFLTNSYWTCLGNGAGLSLDHRTIFLMSHSAGGHVSVEYNKENAILHECCQNDANGQMGQCHALTN